MKRFFAALQFLTVMPLPASCRWGEEDLSRSGPFFPVVGALIGVAVGGLAWELGRILPPWPASVLSVVALIGVSRGLHLDGLSDTADGFLSSRPRERILEIMRDSHVGAMGVIAIVCVVFLKTACLASLDPAARWRAVAMMPVAGRCALVFSLSLLPYARSGGGLATLFYRGRSWRHAAWAGLCLVAAGWAVARTPGMVVAGLSAALTAGFAVYSHRKIGGATGDTLGAACELAEIVPALTLCALNVDH